MNPGVRILEPGQLEAPPGEIRFLVLPDRELFRRRAARLHQLAAGHSLEEYLTFLARLVEAQQAALEELPALPSPSRQRAMSGREQGIPPRAPRFSSRGPVWRALLETILDRLAEDPLPPAARATAAALRHAAGERLEATAERLLAGELAAVPAQEMPFIAAALQVWWLRQATALDEQNVGRPAEKGRCPVCGSLPVAGIVRSGGTEHGLRYLCCSLCATQWHLVRLTCSCCAATDRLDYYAIAGSNGAVKAESCGDCGSYLKLLYLEKDARMEAQADDLATLGLDMLLEREGKRRRGPNLLFHPGGG